MPKRVSVQPKTDEVTDEEARRQPWMTDKLIADGIKVFSKQYGRPVTERELIGWTNRVARLHDLLLSIPATRRGGTQGPRSTQSP